MKLELLIGRDEIGRRVKELAEEISRDYESPLMLGILNGAFIFMADLVREMKIPVEIEFVRVKSYRGVNTTGKVEILMDVSDVKDKDVLIVEDIVDTGITMNFLVKRVMKRGASSVKVCTLLDKPSRRIVDVIPDYVGFTIPDYFVVGYGLDYNGMYRELPEIYRICD
ncbi:MAG: hypoxanthine phosphoribosyltransferase [Archaeoglobus sp.]|nr:MAG: hypoxanthine phosphoribosyltransferase [Archaeoglobus sp.]